MLLVIFLAGTLSTVWVFLVPIFQAPDEPAHFDYAISIYNARRLITLADGKPDWIVSPYTKYLMQAVDFQRIMGHSSMRVQPGYDTREYFARVDATAPSLSKPLKPSGRISYLVPDIYPFGFYALEAFWMRAVSLFTGSLVTLFFAARLLCVFLLMVGLYFNYRTALNLGLPRWTSAALVAAVGFFPLTSLASSYVQPDNLAYALVSASLFFATELRSGAPQLRTVLPLGLSLGLLAVTKYQFFVSAAIPIVALFAVRLARNRSSRAQRTAAVAAITMPTIALVAVQHWVVDHAGSTIRTSQPLDGLYTPIRAALAMGIEPTTHFLLATSLAAFTDFFLIGPCAATYWQVIGWVDTPIVIVNGTIEMLIRTLIALCTAAVVIILAFSILRNVGRLFRTVLRRHARAALSIAVGDPVFNSYICIIAILFVLYVLSDNGFGAEGRHWYPYIFPAFLCFAWYAPRTINKQRRSLSAVLAIVLLSYTIVAATYAVVDLARRYYGPQTARYVATRLRPPQIVPGGVAGVLFRLQPADYHVTGSELPFSYPVGSRLLVTGASLPNPRTGTSRVAVLVDGRTAQPVLYGQYQFRIAEALHSVAAGYSAFFAYIATRDLTEGPHAVEAFAEAPDGIHYVAIHPMRAFFVTAAHDAFSPAFRRSLEGAPVVDGTLTAARTCRGFSSFAGGVRAVSAGAVLLVTGELDAHLGRSLVMWLLVDGKPYPARYDARTGSLVSTVPTWDLRPGRYRAYAYAMGIGTLTQRQLSHYATFDVEPTHGGGTFLRRPPRACSDPLRQLAGS